MAESRIPIFHNPTLVISKSMNPTQVLNVPLAVGEYIYVVGHVTTGAKGFGLIWKAGANNKIIPIIENNGLSFSFSGDDLVITSSAYLQVSVIKVSNIA